jgi:lysozyme
VKEITALLIQHEGLELKPYKDTVGKLTIGVGRNLEDRGITRPEALYLLGNDIADFTAQLGARLPWIGSAPRDVQTVLIDMAFNLGVDGLLQFKNTLALIKAKRYTEAAAAMLDSLWAKQVGTRATDLSNIIKVVK